MIVAILQARMSSSRLPGKVLKPILGKPMIQYEIERIRKSRHIDKLVLATSDDAADDCLVNMCKLHNINVFRGSLQDVLDRYYQCAKQYQAKYIVRLTGDCPVIDWTIIDQVIEKHIEDGNDYTSNTLNPTYPDGLDVEVFNFSAIEDAWNKAQLLSEREHVTPYIYKNPQKFKLGCLKNNIDLSALRWTVDEHEDFLFITQIYERLYPVNKDFLMKDVVDLIKQIPDLSAINSGFQRNEGMEKSLAEDKIFHEKKVKS